MHVIADSWGNGGHHGWFLFFPAERYARGEISHEEYRERLTNLEQ